MALYILKDNNSFNNTKRNKEISYATALNQKRIKTVLLKNINNYTQLLNDPKSVLFITDNLNDSHDKILEFCNIHNIPVITANNVPNYRSKFFFSTIFGDTSKCMIEMIEYIKYYKKERVAFFAVNTDSNHDINNVQTLYRCYPTFTNNDVFFAYDKLSECFDDFFDKRYQYDTVFCVNDFAAIAFIEKMKVKDPNYLKDHFIIGFMNTVLSRLYKISLTSCSYETSDLIQALISIYQIYEKKRNTFAAINITLYGHIFTRQTTSNHQLLTDEQNLNTQYSKNVNTLVLTPSKPCSINYMNEPLLRDLTLIDSMLSSLKSIDLNILYMLLNGSSNTTICDELFLTPQTLQYHLSNMRKAIETTSTSNFINKIKKYISIENLKDYIASVN